VYSAEDDPNELLGRPGQYIAKVNFIDTTVVDAPIAYDVAEGGSIEVFESQDLAQARSDYVQSVTQTVPTLIEYDFVVGTVLLRLSKSLTPDDAGAYEAALATIVQC
jgi:hypothetical protein